MGWYIKRSAGMTVGKDWSGTDAELEAEVERLDGVVQEARRVLSRQSALAERNGERISYDHLLEYHTAVEIGRQLDFARLTLQAHRDVTAYNAARQSVLDAAIGD